MKKTKIEQRIKNAANAFFENDRENFGEESLSFANNSALLKQETAARFGEKGDVLIKILRRTFIFLPGVFYLFFGTMSVFTFELIRENPLAALAAFLIGSFMTIFGIGNIKNPKHLMIPFSVIAVGISAFSLFSMFDKSKYIFEYGIYFFPLALIAPFFAKSLADKTDEIKD
jgi:peptidoglycan/LPS O-acetylase OafA/YrhL